MIRSTLQSSSSRVFFNLNSFIIFMSVIGFQCTDVVLYSVKIWEILAFFSIFYLRKVDRGLCLFCLLCLCFLLISSLLQSYFSKDIYDIGFGFLKSKYIISVVRVVEIGLCFIVFFVTLAVIRNCGADFYFRKFMHFNVLFVSGILFLYCFEKYFFLPNLVAYDGGRLKGFYVEGGPFGLYMGFLILLALRTRKYLCGVVFFAALILAQSKAGAVLVVVGSVVLMSLRVRQFRPYLNPSNRVRFIGGLAFIIFLGAFFTYHVGSAYVSEIRSVRDSVAERPDDTNLIMGRIAGVYIGSAMISEHPLLGVGLGNYSLIRNNEHYRDFFPSVELWDQSSLGVISLLVEVGVLGLLVIVFFTKFLFFPKSMRGRQEAGVFYVIMFFMPFILGAQFYFPYPWLAVAYYRFESSGGGRDLGGEIKL